MNTHVKHIYLQVPFWMCKENILEVLTVLFYEEWGIAGQKRRLFIINKFMFVIEKLIKLLIA